MKYYLGLDNGGTTTKASLYDFTGRELATASAETAVNMPRPGFVERDMDEMWRANCRVIREAVASAGIGAKEIAAVAVCGHGKGLYLWGRDGKPARNGILSSDNRALAIAGRWKSDGTEKAAFARSCQHVMACQPVALLKWLLENEPDSADGIQWIFECKDYVRFRLTGEARAERTDYSGTNLVNLHSGDYDEELLSLFGLRRFRDALPPLCSSTEIAGYVTAEAARETGLLEGTPVAGGMFDIDACALAALTVDEDHACMIAGTWSINEYVSSAPVLDGTVLMNSFYCMPGRYLVEESSPTSAGNHAWFINRLLPELKECAKAGGESVYEQCNRWVESITAGEFCPVFLPFLMASNENPAAMGSFVGLSANHTRAHLMRSVYEGIAFSHRTHYDRLLASRREGFQSVRLAGGAAQSKVWTQMFADVMGVPVETVAARETGTLGCAIAAAAAVGDYSDLKTAAERMTKLSAPVMPIPENVEAYQKKYALYRKTVDALDGVWDSIRNFADGRA